MLAEADRSVVGRQVRVSIKEQDHHLDRVHEVGIQMREMQVVLARGPVKPLQRQYSVVERLDFAVRWLVEERRVRLVQI